jgi:pyoverdine/dityrosine biosynthesis protein Dit1
MGLYRQSDRQEFILPVFPSKTPGSEKIYVNEQDFPGPGSIINTAILRQIGKDVLWEKNTG